MQYPVKNFSSTDGGAPSLPNNTPGVLIQFLKACLIDGYNLQPFDSLEMDGTEGRANFPGSHGFRVHQVIEINGASGAAWNGEHRVTEVGAQWIKFEVEGTPSAETTAGLEIKAAPVGGWEMPLISGDNLRAAFRHTDPSRPRVFWYVDDRGTDTIEGSPTTNLNWSWAFFRGCSDMPDIDTRAEGFGTGLVCYANDDTGYGNKEWNLVADHLAVYVNFWPTGVNRPQTSWVWAFGYSAEAPLHDQYNAYIVQARYATTSTASGQNSSYWGNMTQNQDKVMRRNRDQLNEGGVSLNFHGSAATSYFGVFSQISFSGSDPLSDLIVQYPVLLETAATYRGIAPGVAQPLADHPMVHKSFLHMSGRWWWALGHAYTATTNPSSGQTFLDITGPWRQS